MNCRITYFCFNTRTKIITGGKISKPYIYNDNINSRIRACCGVIQLYTVHNENINFLLYFQFPMSITSERHSRLWQKICERNPIYFGHGVDKPIIRGYKKYIALTSTDAGQRDYWWHNRILRMI